MRFDTKSLRIPTSINDICFIKIVLAVFRNTFQTYFSCTIIGVYFQTFFKKVLCANILTRNSCFLRFYFQNYVHQLGHQCRPRSTDVQTFDKNYFFGSKAPKQIFSTKIKNIFIHSLHFLNAKVNVVVQKGIFIILIFSKLFLS